MACCNHLATTGLTVALPYTAVYNATLASFWSLQESSLLPQCVFTPTTSQEVASFVTNLACDDCKDISFAIKGQGHAPAAGFANIASGITVDFTSMKSIRTNSDHSIAYVDAGASWLDVYIALDPLNKTVAGGRNGAVGVSGLTLGGGISYFSPQVGFTCDTLVNVELVLASGRLVNANATSYSDLFRVLKGGGNNFGIATRFDFQTLDNGQIMAGAIVHTIPGRKAVFEAFADIANAPEYDVHASLVTGLIFNSTSKQWLLTSTPIYTKPVLNPPVYDELYAAPNLTSKKQLVSLHTFANESATPPLNWLFRTGTYGVSADFLETIFEISNKTLSAQPASNSFLLWSMALEPVPSVFLSRGAGKNALGTSAADGNTMILLISALWTDSTTSSTIQSLATTLISKIDQAAAAQELSKRFVYANYAGAQQQPFKSYGAQSEALLYSAARRYDPEGVFQKRVPGGFKLLHQHG